MRQREHGRVQRIAALLVGQVLFLLVYPAFIVVGARLIDLLLDLTTFADGPFVDVVALLILVPGLLLVEWTVGLQFYQGLGTPLPVVATRRLITNGPYRYTRNPMATGTTMVYLGVAIWVGSLSALALASIYPVVVTVYTKLVEEQELERRFGAEYLAYKRKTPFLLPRLPRRG